MVGAERSGHALSYALATVSMKEMLSNPAAALSLPWDSTWPFFRKAILFVQVIWARILSNVPKIEDSTDFFKSGASSMDVVR